MFCSTAVRDPGANAGADVTPQGLRPHSSRLSQDHPVPEVAAHGLTPWQR